ncbi:MAG: bifunctional DNA primase/polymerase [Streptomycetales bacterium]
MPDPLCRRCRTRLIPTYPGQSEHPLCSPTPTGWIPQPTPPRQPTLTASRPPAGPLRLALELAALGWHILPLSPANKRPLGNCPTCRDHPGRSGSAPHPIVDCPCLPAGAWCHGVRAATTNPQRLTTWWARQPDAVPGVAAGPSRLVLIDIDTHGEDLPADLVTGLLPGINLHTEPLPREVWAEPGRYRDGRDTLTLLAHLRGGTHPWPTDPAHAPVAVTTPSGGRHLWYSAPAGDLRQAIGELAWQVDIKAGQNYGLAPAATTTAGTYRLLAGDPAAPGRMPTWLAHETTRVATVHPPRPAPQLPAPRPGKPGPGAAAYLTTVINRGAAHIASLTDGRKRALAALAYHTGGLLAWSGLNPDHVTQRLITAGTASGLPHRTATRVVHRALTRGTAEPLPEPRRAPRAS